MQVPNVGAVINYDFPNGVEDYIHRIGRTGRAGASGEAYTFFTAQDSKYSRELSRVLREANQIVPPELESMQSFGARPPCCFTWWIRRRNEHVTRKHCQAVEAISVVWGECRNLHI